MKKMKAVEELTAEEVAKAIGLPLDEWHGNCYAIACKMVDRGLVEGRAVYGHYYGPVSGRGYWKGRTGFPFQRHGWVVLPDGRLLDPTRWSFENKPSYLAILDPEDSDFECARPLCGHVLDEHGDVTLCSGSEDCDCPEFKSPLEWYDEGGQRVRKEMMRPPPTYHTKDREVKLELSPTELLFVLSLLGTPPRITDTAVWWLANLPVEMLGKSAKGLYKALEKAGMIARVPIDHLNMVLGK